MPRRLANTRRFRRGRRRRISRRGKRWRSRIRLAKAIDRRLATKRRVTADLVGTFGASQDLSSDSVTNVALEPTFQRGTGGTEGDFTGSQLLVTKLRIRGYIVSGATQTRDQWVRILVYKVPRDNTSSWTAGELIEGSAGGPGATTYPTIYDFQAWNKEHPVKLISDKMIKVSPKGDSSAVMAHKIFVKMTIPLNLRYKVNLAGTAQSGYKYAMMIISDVLASGTTQRPAIYLRGRYTYADMS